MWLLGVANLHSDDIKIAVYSIPVTGSLAVWLCYRQPEIFTVHVILRDKGDSGIRIAALWIAQPVAST